MLLKRTTFKHSRNLLIGYLLLLSFSFLIIFFVQRHTYGVLEENIRERNRNALEQTGYLLDQYMIEVKRQSLLLMADPLIDDFLNLPSLKRGDPDIQTVIDASSLLNSYKALNPFISEVYIYSGTSSYLLSSSNAYLYPEKVYEKAVAFEGYSYRQWLHSILKEKHNNEYIPALHARVNGVSLSVIPYLRSLPLDYPFINSGKMILLLNEGMIRTILEDLAIGPQGRVFLADYSGQILTSAGNPSLPEISLLPNLVEGKEEVSFPDGEEYLFFSSRTAQSGWILTYLLPRKALKDHISLLWTIYGFISLIILFCTAGYSLFIILTDMNHWKDIQNLMGGSGSYEELRDKLHQMSNRVNRVLQEDGSGSSDLERIFLYRLFSGNFIDREDPVRMARSLQIPLGEGPFQVFSVELRGQDEIQINEETVTDMRFARIFFRKTLNDILDSRYMILLEDSHSSSILAWDCPEKLKILADRLYLLLAGSLPMDVYCGTGDSRSDLFDVSASYRESRASLDAQINQGEPGIRKYSELSEQDHSYFYPIDAENQLINLTLNGDAAQALRMMDSLLAQNLRDRSLDVEARKAFFHAMAGTLNRIKNRLSDNPEILALSLKSAADEGEVRRVFSEFCRIIGELRTNRNEQLKSALIRYLDEHYPDPDLTLFTIAREFGYRESQLYYFFNNNFRISFAQYLERLRLDAAVRLLQENRSYSINEIALKAGYANTQTFRRAFKKRMGTTPSDYREK